VNALKKATALEQAEIDAPPRSALPLFRLLFVLFLFSFVFDYKALDLEFGAIETGGSLVQFAFLGLALLSGGLASVLGARHLLVRPGVYLVLLWWGYALGSIAVAFAWGNEAGRVLRLSIPLLLVGFGLNATLVAAANGMRPGEAVRWFLVAALVNVVWRFLYGSVFAGTPITEVRMEVLSPAIGFLFAWAGCAFLLRHRFTWWSVFVLAIPLGIALISITRSLALPFAVSFAAAGGCLALGMLWRIYDLKFPWKKLGPLAVMAFVSVFVVVGALAAEPALAERWYQRLFDNRGEAGATTEDLSSLMRKAEAKSMWDILAEEPHSFIWGRGLGASYYWDESYYPELFLVYPDDRHQFPDEIYSAGHSIWTYTLFSTGFVGVGVTLLAFFIPMGLSLHSARLLAGTVMGPRAWDCFLMFLPFVAMWAVLSESITRNPFDERFTGVLFGFAMALPQFFYNRAFFLRHREAVGQSAAQILFDEDELDPDLLEPEPPAREALPGSRGFSSGAAEAPPTQVRGGGHHLVGSRVEYEREP